MVQLYWWIDVKKKYSSRGSNLLPGVGGLGLLEVANLRSIDLKQVNIKMSIVMVESPRPLYMKF